ncbi:MAG: hypothetical protein ABL959_00585 [Pyrinomonadaceae bacterium]
MSDIPKFLSIEERHASFRPVGEYSFDATVKMIDAAIEYCRTNAIRGLLVDITAVTGFPTPSTAERFQFATQWSATAAGRVALAMIAPPEMIDPDKIGVTMANNRGFLCEVFTNEEDAVRWLGGKS